MISKGNHVTFARFVLLAVSGEAKALLPGLLRWPKQDIEKVVEDKDRSTKVAKELFADYVKEKKTERTSGKERVGTNFENILRKRERKDSFNV